MKDQTEAGARGGEGDTARFAWAYPATLFALAIAAPAFLNVNTFGVMRLLWASLEEGQVTHLLDACIRMVILNTLRAFPIYLGALALAGIGEGGSGQRQFLRSVALAALVVPLEYALINQVYSITYDFRMPAILSIVAVAAVLRMGQTRVRQEKWKAASVVGVLVFAFQWLDVAPALTRWGFGHGEISLDIKAAAEVLGAASLLNTYTVSLWATLLSMGLLLSKVMVDYRTHIRLIEEDRRRSVELARVQAEAVQSRSWQELNHLMHDLRTPLTTIQGLSSTLAEYSGGIDPEHVAAYAGRISEAAERMDTMIREMLFGSHMQRVPAKWFARKLASQLPEEKTRGVVSITMADDLPDITINTIRLTRAIINLIDNAIDAGASEVNVDFSRSPVGLKIVVSDNGSGMSAQELARCREGGFSTKNSTGLGLPFVCAVIDDHGAELEITSTTHEQSRRRGVAQGTVCTIILPEAREVDSHRSRFVLPEDPGGR
ncbi:MAG: HAMP domain-containing histidine kinase [Firmicutes bacterium]|jgi:two-component system sporulation sensor kinase B|nr:HAMP domain-containing histidine kinase [Bacillota bacterium]